MDSSSLVVPGSARMMSDVEGIVGLDVRHRRVGIVAALRQVVEQFGDLGGICVIQVEDLRRAGGRLRHVEFVDQPQRLGDRPHLAAQHERVVAFVGNDLHALRPGCVWTEFVRGDLFEHGRYRTHPRILEHPVHDLVAVQDIDLLKDVHEPPEVAFVVGEYQNVRLLDRRHVTSLRHQGPQHLERLGRRARGPAAPRS